MDSSQELFEDDSSEVSDECFDDSFLPYDESLEPVANEEEAAQYRIEKEREDEEEQRVLSRFSGEVDLKEWCMCGHCNLELITKPEECRCCIEYDRCFEKMEAIECEGQCITTHVAFGNVCLDRWVLDVAGISFKKRDKSSYNSGRQNVVDNESVAYRQFIRFVWQYIGAGKRIPLPCCVYHSIRNEYPNADQDYTGYEEDSGEGESEESDSEQDEQLLYLKDYIL